MTEIFISSRLLSFTYKSHAEIRGEYPKTRRFLRREQIGSKSEYLQNARFYREALRRYRIPIFGTRLLCTCRQSDFYTCRFERNISRRLFFSIALRIFTSRRGETTTKMPHSWRIEIVAKNTKFKHRIKSIKLFMHDNVYNYINEKFTQCEQFGS